MDPKAQPRKVGKIDPGEDGNAYEIFLNKEKLSFRSVYLKQGEKCWPIGSISERKAILKRNIPQDIRRRIAGKLGYFCETNEGLKDMVIYK